jgi:hypothetical protein
MTRRAYQWASMQTPVRPCSFKRLTLFVKDATWGGGGFIRSRFFSPRPLKFRKSAYERKEGGFVVLTLEPCSVPSPKGSFHQKFKEAGERAGLETHTSDNLAVSDAQLVFQEEVIFEQRKIRGNAKKCLIKMDKDGDLEGQIRVEMD